MTCNTASGYNPPTEGLSLDNLRLQIRMLGNIAAHFANTTAVHALAAGYVVTMPSPADFQSHMAALQAQKFVEFPQAGRVIGTLGNPNGERIYLPFWDAIPFFVDGAGLHPKLFAVLALEHQTLEDAYKERFPSSFRDDLDVQLTWKELLIFGLRLGEVHPVNDRESKYLAVKCQRVEMQNKLWNDGKLPKRGGPNLEKMWNAAYPDCVTRLKLQSTAIKKEFERAAGQQDALAFPGQTPKSQQPQQQQTGPWTTTMPGRKMTLADEMALDQLTHGIAVTPGTPVDPAPAKRARSDSLQRQGPEPKSTEASLKAHITLMNELHRRRNIMNQEQLAAIRKELDEKKAECAARASSITALVVANLQTRNKSLEEEKAALSATAKMLSKETKQRGERILELETEKAAAAEENGRLKVRVVELTTDNLDLRGQLDDKRIGRRVRPEGAREEDEDAWMA